jgi:hypothetical protein
MIKFAVLWTANENDEEMVSIEERELAVGYLQGALGGDFEVFTLRDGTAMYIDEDGKRKRLKPNQLATQLAREFGGLTPPDFIAGTAVVVGKADGEGADTSLSGPVLEWVLGTFQ